MKRPVPFHSNSVWPPLGLVMLFAVAYGLLDAGLWLIEHAKPGLKGEFSSTPEIMNIRSGILGTAAAFYALYRLWRFHPACNLGYAAWLRSSPWRAPKPLPLGPVHPVWQDAVVVGILTALAQWHAHVDPTLPVRVFGLTYLIAMTLLLAFTRTWIPCLLLGFLWPAPSLPALRGLSSTGVVAALIAVIWYGHRKSLQTFPWRRDSLERPDLMRPNAGKSLGEIEIRIDGLNTPAARTQHLGWPFLWLSPKVASNPISTTTAICLSVLFGWWSYCAIVGGEIPPCPGAILFFATLAALFRLGIYCAGLVPSFNVWGRLASGRIIVPGFDQVFLTPLVAVALATAGGVAIRHAGAWYPAASACVVAVVAFVLFNGGPTMRQWLLTGQHRYRVPAKLGSNKQLLRPI